MELDDRLRKLMQDLGVAINDALTESPGVAEAIETVRESGYDVFLVLEATIGVRRRQPGEEYSSEADRPAPDDEAPQIQLKVNDQDLKFLKSLRIRLDDSDPPSAS